jgi:hypothetical protein
MTNKPIDLIVANVMHDAFNALAAMEDQRRKLDHIMRKAGIHAAIDVGGIDDLPDVIAHMLLCAIAHESSLVDVQRALSALGAPASRDMINEGLQAIRDRQPA